MKKEFYFNFLNVFFSFPYLIEKVMSSLMSQTIKPFNSIASI